MVKLICPTCRHSNPYNNRYCGQCGSQLSENNIIPDQRTSSIEASSALPATQLKQVGKTVAVGLVALAAEAGLAWIRRRVSQVDLDPAPIAQPIPPAKQHIRRDPISHSTQVSGRIISILSRQTVEVRHQDGFFRQTVERMVWHRRQ